MVSVTWRYAVGAQLVHPDLADEDVKTLTKRLTPTLGVYVLLILVGLFLPIVAVSGYLVLALFILIRSARSGGHRTPVDAATETYVTC